MKIGTLKWVFLVVTLGIALLYVLVAPPLAKETPVSVSLSVEAIPREGFLADINFRWLHRHCQPANPSDPENVEGGWLKTLEAMGNDKIKLTLNTAVIWGSGKPLTVESILGGLKKALLPDETLLPQGDGVAELTTSRPLSEILKVLQNSVLDPEDASLVKRPEDMQCFGRFKQIAWKKDRVFLTAGDIPPVSPESPKSGNDSSAVPATRDSGSKAESPGADSQRVNAIEVQFTSKTIKEKMDAYVSGSLDFVGGVPLNEVSPESLRSQLKQKPLGDIFLFFARLEPNGHARVGEFLAKALNRGELHGLPFREALLRPNFHIFPGHFSLGDGRPIFPLLPEFNFASVADAKEFVLKQKPPLTQIKLSYQTSEILSPFLQFFKARLDASYKMALTEQPVEDDRAIDLQTSDLILARLPSSETFVADLVARARTLYPSLKGDFGYFETKLAEKTLSFDQKIAVLQKLEKFLLEKFLVIPLGDVSSAYFLNDQIEGVTWDSEFQAPLFFSSFRVQGKVLP
jgi:hypothetical protein